MKGIEWSETKGVETQHARGSDLAPDITVDEATKKIRNLIYGTTPIHKSELEKRIKWEFDPNNLSRVARALELMFNSGELEEDEEGVIYYDSETDAKEVMNMGKLMVNDSFKDPQTGEILEEGKDYDVPQQVSEEVAKKADDTGKGSYTEDLAEPEELELEGPEEEEGEELEIEPAEGDVWGEMKSKLDTEPETPPKWNPKRADAESGDLEPEDVPDLLGTITNVGKSSPPNQTPFASVETRDGEERTLWCHKTLRSLFLKNPEQEDPEKYEYNVRVGDKVAVRYIGYVKSGGGRGYLNYRWELYDEDGNPKASG